MTYTLNYKKYFQNKYITMSNFFPEICSDTNDKGKKEPRNAGLTVDQARL